MYKYKLKEIEVGDTEIRGGKKSTVTDIDPETGAITWDVADTADFSSTYKALKQAKDFLDTLEKTGESKDDAAIDQFAEEIANLFNAFRTHVRKNYPKEYERVSRLKESVNEQSEQWTQEKYIFTGWYEFT
jgi:transcriptional accessory protein Tex/SPT6